MSQPRERGREYSEASRRRAKELGGIPDPCNEPRARDARYSKGGYSVVCFTFTIDCFWRYRYTLEPMVVDHRLLKS